jgi:hypothetical protein
MPERATVANPSLPDAGLRPSRSMAVSPPLDVPVLADGEGTRELTQLLLTRDDLLVQHPFEVQQALKRANPRLTGNRISVTYNTAVFRRTCQLNDAHLPIDVLKFTQTLRDHMNSMTESKRRRFAKRFDSHFDVLLWFNARQMAPSLKVIQDGMSAMTDAEGSRWSKVTYGVEQPGKDIARLKRASGSGDSAG